jgi:hypothetical protein
MLKKIFLGLGFLLCSLMLFSQTVYAAQVIRERTGRIEITTPDGKTVTIGKNDSVPPLVSGSTIRVLDGSVNVEPTEGMFNVIIGNSSAMIGKGGKINASYDPVTNVADFKYAGGITITTGDTVVSLGQGQQVRIVRNIQTGEVSVKSVKGDIVTMTAGVKAVIPENGTAKIVLDDQTGMVKVSSVQGIINVVSADGKKSAVTQGSNLDLQGSSSAKTDTAKPAEKKDITTPATVSTDQGGTTEIPVTEEPAQPEFPEASPYNP